MCSPQSVNCIVIKYSIGNKSFIPLQLLPFGDLVCIYDLTLSDAILPVYGACQRQLGQGSVSCPRTLRFTDWTGVRDRTADARHLYLYLALTRNVL